MTYGFAACVHVKAFHVYGNSLAGNLSCKAVAVLLYNVIPFCCLRCTLAAFVMPLGRVKP